MNRLLFLIFGCLIFSHLKTFYSVIILKSGNKLREAWNNHKTLHELVYDDAQDLIRFQIFQTNLVFIKKFNTLNTHMKLASNRFSHMRFTEYLRYLKQGYRGNQKIDPKSIKYQESLEVDGTFIDWRKKNAVTNIKNQGMCGSCWAFSSTGALESHYAIEYHELIELSEQELVDCSTMYDNHGCQGGWMNSSFQYVTKYGIHTESSYPYRARDQKCQNISSEPVLKVVSYVNIPSGSEKDLTNAVLNIGPVSVAINAGTASFMFYHSGIYESYECSPDRIDHGVLVVGIGSFPKPYYIIKNSWGTFWGMQGYVNFARNKRNMCGIATAASYPRVKKYSDPHIKAFGL